MPTGDECPLSRAVQSTCSLRKGQIIYDDGAVSDAMYRLQSGCVRLQVNGADGTRKIVRFVFPGDYFGLCLDLRSTSAEAATDVEVTRFALASVLNLSASDPAVALTIIGLSTDAYRDLAHHSGRIMTLPALARVAWFFKVVCRRTQAEGTADLYKTAISGRDIADYLDLTPETLSRSLTTLRERSRSSLRPLAGFRGLGSGPMAGHPLTIPLAWLAAAALGH